MRHDVRKILWDARDALDAVNAFLADKTYEAYAKDRLLRSGVERQFEIAGEALSKLARLDPETASRIPELRRAVDLRNTLIHAYADVDPEVVWSIVQEHLPVLREKLDELLESESSS